MKRRIIDSCLSREEIRIDRIMARGARNTRQRLSIVGDNWDGAGEVDLLPSGATLSGKGRGLEQRSVAGPDVPYMCSSVRGCLYKTNSQDSIHSNLSNLQAYFSTAFPSPLSIVGGNGRGPNTARTCLRENCRQVDSVRRLKIHAVINGAAHQR